jgi:hypothetical protein
VFERDVNDLNISIRQCPTRCSLPAKPVVVLDWQIRGMFDEELDDVRVFRRSSTSDKIVSMKLFSWLRDAPGVDTASGEVVSLVEVSFVPGRQGEVVGA